MSDLLTPEVEVGKPHQTYEEAREKVRAYGDMAGPKLNQHFIEHFEPVVMAERGVPLVDIRIGRDLKLSLIQAVNRGYEQLERPVATSVDVDSVVKSYSDSVLKRSGGKWDENWHKTYVVKTLLLIEKESRGRIKLNKPRIYRAFPGARYISVDPKADSYDPEIEG